MLSIEMYPAELILGNNIKQKMGKPNEMMKKRISSINRQALRNITHEILI
jgi:hypothetical protein